MDNNTKINRVVFQLKKINKYGLKYLIAKIIDGLGVVKNGKLADSVLYDYYKNIDYNDFKEELIFWYEGKTYKKLNIDNPLTYNEKIQWLKLYDNTTIKSQLADKYAVRTWVKDKIGENYLIELLGVWESFDDINFDLLPKSFVLKCNHGSGMNVIIKNKENIDKKELKNRFDEWMSIDFAACNFEPQYHYIDRKIIAEEYLTNEEDDLYDYKFWCNNGHCDFVMFLSDRKNGLKMANFDRDWNLLPFVYDHERIEEPVNKPDNLKKMIELAEVLAEGFPHVRVDFYRLNDGSIKFGEMTFTSMSGVQRWMPETYNRVVGDMMILPNNKEV